jgi:CDP-paratose 2-epimerase
MKILVTGGAGFVGSHLALAMKRDIAQADVVAFDNLRRRGSELGLPRLRSGGVQFTHGDVRNRADLDEVGPFDLLVECSAEPSVHAGYAGSPSYVLDTNLAGTLHCLEAARRHRAGVIFLSTSRVYPMDALRALPLERRNDRLALDEGARGPGWSARGISTEFPLNGPRTMYGATKLAAEHFIEEYRAMYGLRTVINRCGVIAGPWQMGKVDQGFLVLWAARHLFGGRLAYTGFGGHGLQVRDVLHVDDLSELIVQQAREIERFDGGLFNVGGGPERSVSLAELTRLCEARTRGRQEIGAIAETSAADVPYYVTDNAHVTATCGWRPQLGVEQVLDDVLRWLRDERSVLEPILGDAAGEPVAARPLAS